jgi:uncharacterized membrane protein (DUF485 family)
MIDRGIKKDWLGFTALNKGEKSRRDFLIGMSFIVFSFVVYFGLFSIPLFPLTKKEMASAATIGYLFSWILTGIGIFFAGKEGYEFLKEKILMGFFRKIIGRKEK